METLFIGSTRRGYLALEALHRVGARLCGILSLNQFANESERYEEYFAAFAQKHGIPFFQVKNLRAPELSHSVQSILRPEAIFVIGCRQMLPPEIYQSASKGTFALHDSLLPLYRGFAPTNWAIINGEKETGVSMFRLTEAMDAGDVVAQAKIAIAEDESADQVYEKVCDATVALIERTFKSIADDSVKSQSQDIEKATYTCARSPEDGLVDWTAKTKTIYNQIRALTRPYPGAFTHLGTKKLILWKASVPEVIPNYVGRIPGRIVGLHSNGNVDILTGDGMLTLEEVELEGEESGKPTRFLKSVRTSLGLNINELLARVSELERLLAGKAG